MRDTGEWSHFFDGVEFVAQWKATKDNIVAHALDKLWKLLKSYSKTEWNCPYIQTGLTYICIALLFL